MSQKSVTPQTKPTLSLVKFLPLMVLMISVVALPTDAMLAALFHMGPAIDVEMLNDQHLVISSFFLVWA